MENVAVRCALSVLVVIVRDSALEQIVVFEDGVAGVNCEQVCYVCQFVYL